MGLELDDPSLSTSGHDCSSGASEAPPMATVAAVNDAAHSSDGTISLLLGSLDDGVSERMAYATLAAESSPASA